MAVVEYLDDPRFVKNENSFQKNFLTGAFHKETFEKSITIMYNGVPIAVTQGSPFDLADLGVGYLLSESLISDRGSLAEVRVDPDQGIVSVWSREKQNVFTAKSRISVDLPLSENSENDLLYGWHGTSCTLAERQIRFVMSSGQANRPATVLSESTAQSLGYSHSLDAFDSLISAESLVTFRADDLLCQMEKLCLMSPHRNAGACVHGCGLGRAHSTTLMLVREDIGRHNAMDKLLGKAWLDQISLVDKALFITGRISAEMAAKALKQGAAVLVSHKSATQHAIQLAQRYGLTLVSHCRDNHLCVHAHGERVKA